METKRSKIPRILFYISFAPAVLLLICAIISIWSGMTFLFSTSYGRDAFAGTIILGGLVMCYIPIFPICLIYQIAYLLRDKIKAIGKIAPKKYFGVIGIIIAVIIGAALFPEVSSGISRAIETNAAKTMYKNADEKIDYYENYMHMDGVLGIEEQKTSCILLDYDTNTVGILFAGDYPKYNEIKLIPSDENTAEISRIRSELFVQTVIPLNNLGRLITFCSDEANRRTAAIILENADGSVLYADNIVDKDTGNGLPTGLIWSDYYVGENMRYDDIPHDIFNINENS